MEFEDSTYENQYGKCAYLAGAIRVICDALDMATCKAGVQYEALASDVFCIGENEEMAVNDLVRERLEKLILEEFGDARREKRLEAARQLDLQLEPCDKPMKEVILDCYRNKQDVDFVKLEAGVEEYCRDVEYYLGKPQEILRLTNESARKADILGEVYLYVLFNAFFVRFESHMLMFLRGSVE